ncbi:MAG: hypothetical protein ACYDGN_13085 [Acidimicrobiales bacterium]
MSATCQPQPARFDPGTSQAPTGRLVTVLAGSTEADPAAILLQLCTGWW